MDCDGCSTASLGSGLVWQGIYLEQRCPFFVCDFLATMYLGKPVTWKKLCFIWQEQGLEIKRATAKADSMMRDSYLRLLLPSDFTFCLERDLC